MTLPKQIVFLTAYAAAFASGQPAQAAMDIAMNALGNAEKLARQPGQVGKIMRDALGTFEINLPPDGSKAP